MTTTSFRFRPRFRGLALGAVALGAALVAVGLMGATGAAAAYALGGGAAGLVLGLLYLASPAWRLTVIVDDDALEVMRGNARRFRLPWPEVKRVVASAETRTCFVDGGGPERSLLVPGPGASAPYDIQDKAALYQAIVERAPGERIEWVALIETARLDAGPAAAADAGAASAAAAGNATPAPATGDQGPRAASADPAAAQDPP